MSGPNQISFTIPNNFAPDTYKLQLLSGYKIFSLPTFTVTAGTPGLSLTRLTPNLGSAGTSLVLIGTGFTPTTNVIFTMPSTGVLTVLSPTNITPTSMNLYIPSTLPVGSYQVTVNDHGATSNALPFGVIGITQIISPPMAIPPTVHLSSAPYTPPVGRGGIVLTWSSTYSKSCKGSSDPDLGLPNWANPPISGSMIIYSTAVTRKSNLTLTCTGDGGTATANLIVIIPAYETSPTYNPSPSPSSYPTASPSPTIIQSAPVSFEPGDIMANLSSFFRNFGLGL